MAWDVVIAEVLADDAGILGFGQGVVIGMARPGLGELDMELVEQLGVPVVDIFRAVIGVEAADDKGKGLQDELEHRHQETFADASDGEHALELGDLIDGVDVIDPFDAIQIALVYGIQAQITGLALRSG